MRIEQGTPFAQAAPFVLVLAFAGAACASDRVDSGPWPGPETPPAGECSDPNIAGCVVTSGKPRIVAPSVPDADVRALASGNTAFALDLHRRVGDGPGNLFYSPYSVSSALAMTFAGARGETELQMADALRFTLPQDRLHPAFNALDQALARRGEDGEGFRLHVVNAIWGQTGASFLPSFLDVLAENYGAGMRVVDFERAPGQARDLINGWVAERTNGKIKDILPEQSIRPSTRLVLTNAIYFKAAWQFPFKKERTAPGDFTREDGSTVSVPMMTNTAQVRYGEGEGYAALEMPYEGRGLVMVLVLPSDRAAFEAGLDPARLESVVDSLGPRSVSITLPRFKIESSIDLVPPLQALGMPIAFTDRADFSGIDGHGGLSINDVIHKAFVSVDEAGTEAAAATAVGIGETSAPAPATIRFDRPFLLFIRDNATNTILFIGRVADPSA